MNIHQQTILQGIQSLLHYHRSLGLTHYPRSDSLDAFLKIIPPPASVETRRDRGGTVRGKKTAGHQQVPLVSLADIGAEVNGCHACELHTVRLYPVAGKGNEKVRLLIVGDWLSAEKDGKLPPDRLFGVEQDVMLERMLGAIHLPMSQVFVTNVIKCAVPATCQPKAVHVQSCVSFLRRQILVLRPEIICTMGMVAAKAVLEKPQPLSRLRGTFHVCEVEKGVSVPVMATYHPTYLLQNPEMKRATWADLQMLAKRLGLQSVG